MIRRFVGLIVLASCSSIASACINDEEAPAHEREFRSSYLVASNRFASKDESSGQFINEAWLYAGGAVMVIGALAFSTRRERAASGRKPCADVGRDLS